MRTFISTAVILTATFVTTSAQAQFDGLFRNVQKQVKREVQRQVPQIGRQIVENVVRDRHVTLPYPPPQHQNPVYPKPHPCPTPRPYPTPRPAPCPPGSGGHCTIRPVPVPPPAPPAPPQPEPPALEELPQAEAGQSVTLDGQFGATPGAIAVKIDSLLLEASVTNWTTTEVTTTLPLIPLATATRATIVVLTAQGELAEAIDIAFVPSTAPVTPEPELPAVSAGQELTLEGDLGNEPGQVQLQIGSMNVLATVLSWSSTETTVRMPQLPLMNPTAAELMIVRSNGQIADSLSILFSPAAQQVSQR